MYYIGDAKRALEINQGTAERFFLYPRILYIYI